MNKVATVLVVVLIFGFVAVKMTGNGSEETQSWLDEQRIEEKLANYKNFKQTLDETLESLAERKLGLKEAHMRVLAAAQRFAPNYLAMLPFCEPGATNEERAVHNLVGHLKTWAEVKPSLAPRVRELEIELAQLITVEK